MKLEINTNGSWRTVLRGMGGHDLAKLDRAKKAAAELTAIDGELSRKPHQWRLVSEANGRVLAYCGIGGWKDTAVVEYAE